ncbi:MAG: hypothetical protein ATN35_12220 [Epulopiscium sp. Nele67-Bin004]|nr:MAG: hypothetical protein ATN35_12220 [Epulopiscium sp. Nele67-Bin004]
MLPFLGGKMLDLLIKNKEQVYAHTSETKPKETLEQHLDLTMHYFEKIYNEKNLSSIEENFIKLFNNPLMFKELLRSAIYLHDIGKVNVDFQILKMDNKQFGKNTMDKGEHSLLSSLIYLDYYYKEISKNKDSDSLVVAYINAYVISRHHGGLSDISSFQESLQKLLLMNKDNKNITYLLLNSIQLDEDKLTSIYNIVKKRISAYSEDWENSIPYIYARWLYSVLVACDFYATSHYLYKEVEHIGVIDNPQQWQVQYEKTNLVQSIRNQNVDTMPLNKLRTELFLEVEQNAKNNLNELLYYLEAPTGIGKTNTSINLAMQLLNNDSTLNKIFYVFPFNTLAEQTYNALKDIYNDEFDIAVVNSITPFKEKDTAEDAPDYGSILLDNQFLHYDMVVTSHVGLFDILFGTGREQTARLYQLCNSIIILDEIQSYKNIIWTEIIGFLNMYSKLLNIRIIIMSATLPYLGKLIGDDSIVKLVNDRDKYYNNPLIKNRVKLDFEMIGEENTFDALNEKIAEHEQQEKKILVEFINKQSAYDFYIQLKEMNFDTEIVLITGDDNKFDRRAIIKKIKKSDKIIVISTQVIEAGVDIDMDIGFKDISLLDAEEQFLGRINRSCLKENCIVYFFNLDNLRLIYKEDLRTDKLLTLAEPENRQYLVTKNFDTYYDKVLEDLLIENKSCNDRNVQDFLRNKVGNLDFKKVEEKMQLIDNINMIQVFLARKVVVEDGEIDGKDVWEQYQQLIDNNQMDYAKRKVELSKLSEKLDLFIWNVIEFDKSYNEQIGGIYYIEDGEQYFEDGKFNRKKLTGDDFELL